MFIFSFKLSKLLKGVCVCFCVCLFSVLLFSFVLKPLFEQKSELTVSENVNNISEKYEDKRIEYLNSKNLKVVLQPIQIVDIMVPEKIVDEYQDYNDIQLKQGFDMRKYKGKVLKQWTYKIKTKQNSYVSLLMYNNDIVGCHVLSDNVKMTIEDFMKK